MRKPKKEIQLTSYDELLGINEAEQNMLKKISPFFKWDGLLHVLVGEKFL